MIYYAAKIKPFRTVETEELRQESILVLTVDSMREKRVEEPIKLKFFNHSK